MQSIESSNPTMCLSPNPNVLTKIEAIEAGFPARMNLNRIDLSDISIQSVLGTGSFCIAYRVDVACLDEVDDNGASQKYALKRLDTKRLASDSRFVAGVEDLVSEAAILSTLNHTNIIKLRGISSQRLSEAYKTSDDVGYFLILEMLRETLADLFKKWRDLPLPGSGKTNMRVQMTTLCTRLERYATGLSSAFEYLHERGIVYHDLKPENVGVDSSGIVKLFDFGFARYEKDMFPRGVVAGTLRYMAPETMLGECSGLPSDVYSFGVVLWELCTLRKPFEKIESTDVRYLREQVTFNDLRAGAVSLIPSKGARKLIKACWEPDPMRRPNFTEISESLSEICASLRETYDKLSTKENSRSRSSTRRSQICLSNLSPVRCSSLPSDELLCPSSDPGSKQRSRSLHKLPSSIKMLRSLFPQSDSSGSFVDLLQDAIGTEKSGDDFSQSEDPHIYHESSPF